jgi:hypothetical protein
MMSTRFDGDTSGHDPGARPPHPVMVAGGPPSTPLPEQAEGVDAGLRRHDGVACPEVPSRWQSA